MAKIIRLRTPKNNVVESLEQLLERAKRGEIEGFVFAAKQPDKDIATSWANVDIGTRNELISHMQIDVMFGVVQANMDQLIEEI